MTDQEKDQVNEVVTEAFEENFKELEEKKSKADETDKTDDKGEEAKKEGAEGEDQAESMDEGDDEEETEDDGESAGESEETKGASGDGEKKGEEEDPSNLQLAWEMLELAKVVYSKQLEAGEDIQECLKKEENLPKDARIVAETHYQLGVAQGFNSQFDEAVESLKNAINILKSRIAN